MNTEQINDIKEQCIKRWGEEDEKILEFRKKFDEWCVFSNEEDTQICLELLKKFNYYSKSKVNEELKKTHEELLKIFKIDPNYTIYTILKDRNGRANSSMEYFWEYVHINEINKKSRIVDIDSIEQDLYENIENIVIIDDCIGSGQTTKSYLERNREKLLDKKIYLILIHLVIEEADKLVDFAKEQGYNLIILCRNKKQKAFGEAETQQKEKFIDLSKDKSIPLNHILGRDDVEALMAFYNNTPNNTLGIFWYKTEKNTPLFPREKSSRPAWMMKQNKEKRKQQNYINARRK